MANLKQRIDQDMKNFMRARDKDSLEAIRFLIARIKQQEIDSRVECSDDDVIQIIIKMIKQGKDSKEQFENSGREELAQKEAFQIDIFSKYLPKALSEAEILDLISEAISEVKSANSVEQLSMAQMGQVMAILKPKCQGKFDMGQLSKLVKAKIL